MSDHEGCEPSRSVHASVMCCHPWPATTPQAGWPLHAYMTVAVQHYWLSLLQHQHKLLEAPDKEEAVQRVSCEALRLSNVPTSQVQVAVP